MQKTKPQMNLYFGVTDNTWFNNLRYMQDIDEVNFWQPGINEIVVGVVLFTINEIFHFINHNLDKYY